METAVSSAGQQKHHELVIVHLVTFCRKMDKLATHVRVYVLLIGMYSINTHGHIKCVNKLSIWTGTNGFKFSNQPVYISVSFIKVIHEL